MRRFALATLLLAACAGPPATVERVPLVEVEPPPPDETPEIRTVLDSYLNARWTFDYEASHAFVTPEDAAEPWHDPMEEQLKKARYAEYWNVHTWRIGEVEIDGNVAVASVDLIGPGVHELMLFQISSSMRMIKATSRWLRDRKKQEVELKSVRPARRVRTLTYRLHKVGDDWRVYMDWPGLRILLEEQNADAFQEMFERFEGSEKELHTRARAPDERTEKLLEQINRAERAVNDRDFTRARRLYEALLVSDAAVPEFLSERLQTFDALEKQQQEKLAHANVEIGPLRDVGGTYEVRAKNGGSDLRSFRLVAEYVDDKGEQSYRTVYEREIAAGEVRTVVVHPRRNKPAVNVRLVDVSFNDRDLQKQYAVLHDKTFHRRLQDLKTGGTARSNADRVARVIEDNATMFDACPWSGEAFVDLWIEVKSPPVANVSRALTDDEKLAKCLSDKARSLEYPDAADNRSVVRVYPKAHWWRSP